MTVTNSLFSVEQFRCYCKRNIDAIQSKLGQALKDVLTDFGFIDANHGHLILISMMQYLQDQVPGFADCDPISKEQFVAVLLTALMTRIVFEGMVAEHPPELVVEVEPKG